MSKALHLLVSGRVQGVGYRDSMRVEAMRAGCTGWVRNLKDGRVEAVVEGDDDAVDLVVQWARLGPPAARVEDLGVSPAQAGHARFEVLRTA